MNKKSAGLGLRCSLDSASSRSAGWWPMCSRRSGSAPDPEALAERISADERLRKLIEERLAAGDTARARAAVEDRVVTLLAEREQLDATIWAEERLAQR